MESGFSSYKDIFVVIINSLGVAAIIFAVLSFKLKKKNNYFLVVNNLVNKFQEKFLGIETFDSNKTKAYVDLVNEEIFYIQYGYVPFPIAVEWVDGIIDILPVFYKGNQIFTNPDSPINEKLDQKLLNIYPRINNVFKTREISETLDLTKYENIVLRKKVVSDIIGNIFKSERKKRKALKELNKIYHNL